MKIICPNCQKVIVVKGLGRKPFAIPVIIVYDTLRLYRNVQGASEKLGCSRGYIYKVLRQNKLKPKEVINSGTNYDKRQKEEKVK